ncbi:MAG TPA: hypothetical protein VEY10_12345 [Flavisolibacter sp.]|jgi:hypothetical protein|nr:hypothetical protein [Flavisolibacter sp.]
MRKQSFLSLSVILMLFTAGCSKENLQVQNPAIQIETTPKANYSSSYSGWSADVDLNWSDGATIEPSRVSELPVPDLTQQMLDDGSIVLIYAKSHIDGSVQSMPAAYSYLNNETNAYSASHLAGSIFISHTKTVNGTSEVPTDANEISFRYIIVKPYTADPNGRAIIMDAFLQMSYKEVVDLLRIPG